MDRRELLSAGAVATAVAGTGAAAFAGDNRLFGRPESLEARAFAPHLLKLHLEVGGNVPKSKYGKWLALSQLANDIISDHTVAASFRRDPKAYLTAAGFPDVEIDAESHEFLITEALANPLVHAAAKHGDVVAFIQTIRALGLAPPVICGGQEPVPIGTATACNVYTTAEVEVYAYVAIAVITIAEVAAVVYAVADGAKAQASTIAQIASVTGGRVFANDVIKKLLYDGADNLVRAVEDGRIEVGDVDKAHFVDTIKQRLALHAP